MECIKSEIDVIFYLIDHLHFGVRISNELLGVIHHAEKNIINHC